MSAYGGGYGKPTGPPSVYSHVTTRSSANLRSGTSVKSLKIPWYQKPLIHDSIFLDVQRAAFFMGIFSLILSIFTIITACFDLYCYSMAAPGSTHYGYYVLSYQFVYVGSRHVRNTLVMFAVFSILASMGVFVTSIMLIIGLRKEHEKRMVPWLYAFAIFTVFRFLAYVFFAIVNDMIFAYNIIMCLLWTIFMIICFYGWILVYSMYIELTDLTKLEDLAHLRVEVLSLVSRPSFLREHFNDPPSLGTVDFASNYMREHQRACVKMRVWKPDGHYAVAECIDRTFPGGISSDDTPQYGLHDARILNSISYATDDDISPIAGPSRSISFFTDTDISLATKCSTEPTLPLEYIT